ncbi:MAG: hypothetical protein ACPHY8_01855 [Patescibacteria group bacterium]
MGLENKENYQVYTENAQENIADVNGANTENINYIISQKYQLD